MCLLLRDLCRCVFFAVLRSPVTSLLKFSVEQRDSSPPPAKKVLQLDDDAVSHCYPVTVSIKRLIKFSNTINTKLIM